ncbi:glycoside hydrolase family 2 protein [Hungatella sp. SB206]|uniref:glycoside hydrolase family 2 protein n=1 Tax=Hungatella sp. SB206 TaxID=2937758 RepID=UPI003DA83D67
MRKTKNLNDRWQFTGPDGRTVSVNLPHTWNNVDGQDGGNNYWRGSCRYERELDMPEFQKGEERVYLEFRGVNASARVCFNDTLVCTHDGGYSTFRVDVTDLLRETNRLAVEADNGVNDRVYPQKADFTFYGGIYRDVNLVVVNRRHFALADRGGNGIRITPQVKELDGYVRVQTFTEMDAGGNKSDAALPDDDCEIRIVLLDSDGAAAASGTGADCTLVIPSVHLWDGLKDPYLYTAVARLEYHGKTVDEIRCRFGVRTFHVDPEKGFFLNGRSYPLRGVSRHQDWKGLGNAITKEHHQKDMELIREIGANTVRLAHYQHDQYFYDLCDESGLVVWAEIPYISEHMANGRANTISQMKELIVQNYNHPCIVCWGVSNEITISTKNKKDMLDNHRELNELCHEMDPTRLTTLACYAMCGPFNRSAHITDLVSWNLYLGWYVPGLFLNDWWMRFFHFRYPKRCLGYSEYGCEAMPNLHSGKPRRGDHSEEYQTIYHEYMLKCFERNPYLWATHVWNMFDFAADARDQGGEAGMNHKGLVTFDRKIKKDSFYLYKAYWSEEPFVHIAGRRRADREESVTTVKVYTNQPKAALYADGKLMEEQTGDRVFNFCVPLNGTVTVEVRAGECRDTAVFHKVAVPNPAYKLVRKKSSSANWV